MDNGRTAPTNDNQPFFTAGQGVDDIDKNTFEAENNLDTSSSENAEWNIASTDRNLGAIGDAAMDSHERASKAAQSQELGEIVDMAMPPSMLNPETLPLVNKNTDNPQKDDSNIDKTEASAIADTQEAVDDFYRDKISPATLLDRKNKDSDAYREILQGGSNEGANKWFLSVLVFFTTLI